MERNQKEWVGSPLDMGDNLAPNGIEEITVEFASGDVDVFRARQRDGYGSYELEQMSEYLDYLAQAIGRS